MQFTPGCVAALSRRLLGRNLPRALSSQPSNAPGFYGMPLGLPRARAWPVRPRPVFGGAWPFALRLKAICRAAVGISWSCSITFVEVAAPQMGTSLSFGRRFFAPRNLPPSTPWSKPQKVAAPAPPLRGRLTPAKTLSDEALPENHTWRNARLRRARPADLLQRLSLFAFDHRKCR